MSKLPNPPGSIAVDAKFPLESYNALRAAGDDAAKLAAQRAFTVAFERPDLFRKVLSHVGSFTDIRGGDHYPSLVRQ